MLDTPFNWRRTLSWSNRINRSLAFTGAFVSVVQPCTAFVPKEVITNPIEIRDWLYENGIDYKMFGRFFYHDDRHFDTMMTYMGLSFQFTCNDACIHFRMRWDTQMMDAA